VEINKANRIPAPLHQSWPHSVLSQ